VIKTIQFPDDIESKVSELASLNRRSFSSQVIFMVDLILNEKSQQARELAEAIEAAR